MKRTIIALLLFILIFAGVVQAKSTLSVKELFGQKYSMKIAAGVFRHTPYLAGNTPGQPWQSGFGEKKIMVLMVEFPDEIHRVKRDLFEDIWISDKRTSIRKYYDIVSNQRLQVSIGSWGIKDWMMMPKSFEQYIVDGDYDYLTIMTAIMDDSVKKAVSQGLDVSEYDADGNGLADMTVFFLSGNSESVGGYMFGDFTYTTDKQTIVMVAEDYWAGEYNSPTLIHEMAHAMVPIWDLYDYSYTSYPVIGWDIMGAGSWVGNCGMSSFTRWKAGWVDLKMLDQPGEYELDDLNGNGENKAFGVAIPGSDREWLLLENRQRTGVDSFFNGIPSEGIAVYIVDDKRPYEHRFNTLTKDFKIHGFRFLSVLKPNINITPDTSPSTLPYNKVDKLTPNIGIRGVSAPGSKMRFTLSFDRPKLPVVSVNNKVYLGKIVKGQKKTFSVQFQNAGIGTLHIFLSTSDKSVSIDRTSFIGNDESIQVTIDATGKKLGAATSKLQYINISSEAGGYIEMEYEISPIHGDLDADEKVDETDLKAFLKLYGLKGDDPGFKPEADFNSDGVIDFEDLCLLAKNFKDYSR
jgi:M6 family metalloprotease-like protein